MKNLKKKININQHYLNNLLNVDNMILCMFIKRIKAKNIVILSIVINTAMYKNWIIRYITNSQDLEQLLHF